MARMFDTPIFSGDQSIDRVLGTELPVGLVFIDGKPPAALEQAMNQLARQHAGQLLVVQLIAKDNPQSVGRFDVHRFPAVVTVKNGQVQSKAEHISGSDLEPHVNFLLGKGPRPAAAEPAPQQAYTRSSPAGSYAGGNGQAAGTSTATDERPVAVTDRSFDQEVLRSPVPVLVDFWAEWCGPCRMMEPVLQKLAREMSGQLKIAKLNVDENPQSSGRYGVQAIPTMMVVKDGRIVDRWSGALPEGALRSRLAGIVY